eukprot:gene5937-7140_t
MEVVATLIMTETWRGWEVARLVLVVGMPALLTSLFEPVISATETRVVGQAGTLALAALMPGTSLFAAVSEVSYSFSVITTGFISNKIGLAGESPEEVEKLQGEIVRSMNSILLTGIAMGTLVCIAFFVGVTPSLGALGVDPSMRSPVANYISVRALSIPFFLIIALAEGGYIGKQDTVTPMWIYGINCVVTILGLVAVATFMPSIMLTGSAACYMGGMVITAAYAVWLMCRDKMLKATWSPSFIPREELFELLNKTVAYAIGVFTRMAIYSTIAALVMSWGPMESAAHKICYEGYWLLSFFTEPMFTAANALLPRELARDKGSAKFMVRLIIGLSVALGAALFGGAWACTTMPIFTSDPELLLFMRPLSLPLACTILLSSVVYSLEGIMVGLNQVKYLRMIHSCNFFVMSGYLYLVRTMDWGMLGVWYGLIKFRAQAQAMLVDGFHSSGQYSQWPREEWFGKP